MCTESREEEEYLDFLEQFGHINFTNLDFLPVLRSVPELEDKRKLEYLSSPKMIRTNTLLFSNDDFIDPASSKLLPSYYRMNKSKASKGTKKAGRPQGEQVHKDLSKKGKRRQAEEKNKLSEIQEADVEQSGEYGQENADTVQEHPRGTEGKNKQEVQEGEITAERFDFTFCDYFYRHRIQVDEFGERLTSGTCEMARIITKDGLIKPDEDDEQSEEEDYYNEEDLDEKGNPIKKRKGPKVIPKEELSRVFYMQYRVDKITPTRKVEKAVNEGIGGLVVQQDNELGGDSHSYVPEPGLSK